MIANQVANIKCRYGRICLKEHRSCEILSLERLARQGRNLNVRRNNMPLYSNKSIFWKIYFSQQNAYLRNEQELERIEEVWPPLKLKNNGGLNCITLSNSSPLKRKTHFLIFLAIFKSHLSPKILIFEKNPFTTAVSMPKSFHLTPCTPTFEIHQPTLIIQ